MKKSIPQLLISNSKTAFDIHYLCGIYPPESTVLLLHKRLITLVVSEMERNRIRRTVKSGITVLSPAKLGVSYSDGMTEWIKKLLHQKGIDSVIVPEEFPIGIADQLRADGVTLNVSKKPLVPQRAIKTPEEIKAVKKSQQAAVIAMKAAIAQIASADIGKEGILRLGNKILTSETVRATIAHSLLDAECSSEDTIVSGGVFSADPHEEGAGPLFAGQPIVIDIFPRSRKTGYWGDITRTVCRGPAPKALKKQYQAVKAAQAVQLKAVKEGVWADDIHKIGVTLMEDRGFKTEMIQDVQQGFIHGTGHGVGLEIHEAPGVSSGTHKKLKAGNIITIEPGLYYSEIGGVRIEDTILVTQDGYKMLAPCPKKLEI